MRDLLARATRDLMPLVELIDTLSGLNRPSIYYAGLLIVEMVIDDHLARRGRRRRDDDPAG